MPAQPAWFHRLDEKWLQPARAENRYGGCAICRWPSPGPVGSDTRLAPERSSRLAASVTRPCSCRPCPSLASAALFLPRQGLSVSAIRG